MFSLAKWLLIPLLLIPAALAAQEEMGNQRYNFPGGWGLELVPAFCADIPAPPTPPTGEVLYCKSGSGWCAKDAGGTERCTGGAGGSSAFSSLTNGINTTATAMVVGTGASLTATGTGTVGATELTGFTRSVTEFGVVPNAGTDQSTVIQTAIDTAGPGLYFPAGTYLACNLVPRASPNQIWSGAGKHSTVLQATAACTNLITLAGASGPAISWEVEGFTFKTNTSTGTLLNLDGTTTLRLSIHDNAFDLGTAQVPNSTGGPAGVAVSGGQDLLIAQNECYSVLPGYGKCFTVFRGGRNAIIKNNTWRWVYQGIEVSSLQGSEDLLIDGNTGDLGWYAEPVKFTNSGGTVTYGATTLTDTAANFSGLCGDTGTAGACAGSTGNFVRVMTPLVTNSITGNFSSPGVVTDAGVNFVSLGVSRGMILRSGKECRGNGSLAQNQRGVCAGGAGGANWGDSCICTATADCSSGICEARFTTVTGVIDTTHLNVDGWLSDVDRRPVTPPFTAAPYSLYSWVIGQVGSYTTTVITLGPNNTNWFNWFGTTSTPSSGTLYEVLTHHPNYQVLVDPNAVVQKGRIVNNTFNRGYSDQIGLQVLASNQDWVVANNQIADGQDIGIDLFPAGSVAIGNTVDHQGTRGIAAATNTVVTHNSVQDSTWTNNVNTVSLGDIQSSGATTVDHNLCRQTIAMANHRYGIVNTGAGGLFDANQFVGTWTVGNYRFESGSATNNHVSGYHGETISNNAGSFSIEGGLATFAQLPAANNGSLVGCSDCTVDCTAGASNGQNCARVNGAWTAVAATASALAANPTDCSANQYATTIDASGNLTCAQVTFAQLSGAATDAQVPDILTLNLPSSTLTGMTANTSLIGTGVGTGAFAALPAGGTNGCSGALDKPLFNATTHAWTCGVDSGGGGGMTSFNAASDGGTTSTITDGTTLTISGGVGLTGTGNSGTKTITLDLDIPVAVANGGTGKTTGTALNDIMVGGSGIAYVDTLLPSCSSSSSILQYNNATQAFGCPTTYPYGSLSGTPASFVPAVHGFLDSTVHSNTLTGTPVRGDFIVANGTPAWTKFAKGTTNQVIAQGALDPVWTTETLLDGVIHSDTAAGTVAQGDLIVGNATPKWGRLAGDTSNTRKFLRGLSVAGVAGIPVWDSITDGDVPDILTLNLPSSTLTGITDDSMLMGTGAGTGAYIPMPTTGTNGCSGATDKLLYNTATNSWVCGVDAGAGGGMTSFNAAGDTGTPQPITDGNTLTIAGGSGLNTVASATDTVTVGITAPIPIALGGTNGTNKTTAFNNLSPLNIRGDLLSFDGATNVRIPLGLNNRMLGSNGTDAVWEQVPDLALANPYSGVGTCAASNWASSFTRNGVPGCTQPSFTDIAGSITDAQVPDGITVNLGLGANGLVSRTALSTYAARTLTPPAAGITVTNGDGVAGNPTLGLANDLGSLEGLGTTGIGVRTATDTWTTRFIAGGSGISVAFGDGVSGNPVVSVKDPIRVDGFPGIDCTGGSDSSNTGWPNVLAALPAVGGTIYLKSGCLLRAKSPGTVHPAFKVPANVHILCADESAGFAVDRQTCHAGQYQGAACNLDAECTAVGGGAASGGSCADDFGTPSPAGPCNAGTCFAPVNGSTYTLLGDDGAAGNNDVFIENCSLFVAQADPYQLCVSSGAHNGNPCRQECDGAGTSTAGLRCETNADCGAGSGVCLRVSDCHADAGPGTCGGISATKTPAGNILANIRALALGNTARVKLEKVNVFDPFQSDFTVQTGASATLTNDNFARELTDCTSPIPSIPATSQCFGNSVNAGACCYGAIDNPSISSGNHANTQPATAVTNQVITGTDAQLTRVYARGMVAGSAISVGSRSHIANSNTWPVLTNGADHLGPGTPGGGYAMSDTSQLLMSYALDLGTSAVCLTMSGANSGNVGLKCNGASILNGVVMSGANSHTEGANIRGLNATNAVGVSVAASGSAVASSYIEGGGGGTSSGISVTGGNGIAVTGNTVNSVPVDSLASGITYGATLGNGLQAVGNTILNVAKQSLNYGGGFGNGILFEANTSILHNITPGGDGGTSGVQYCTPTFHPIHINDGSLDQGKVYNGNFFYGGCKGLFITSGLLPVNANIQTNRFYGIAGSPVSIPFPNTAAGISEMGNYVNDTSSTGHGAGWSTSCDASCDLTHAGISCNQDSDCGTCTATNKCVPDAFWSDVPTPHFSASGNIFYQGSINAVKQCTVAGPVGQVCDVAAAGGTCNAGAVCSGTPATCQTGADQGKRCCQTGAGATCGFRQNTPGMRFPDTGSALTWGDTMLVGNQLFGIGGFGNVGNVTIIDMLNTAGTANSFLNMKIAETILDVNPGSTGPILGIRFPTTFATIRDFSITNNNLRTVATSVAGQTMAAHALVNYQAGFGALGLEGGDRIFSVGTALRVTAGTTWFAFNQSGASSTTETTVQSFIAPTNMTIWKLACNDTVAPGAATSDTYVIRGGATGGAGTSSTLNCVISGAAATSCVSVGGSGVTTSSPFAVTSGQTITIMDTVVGTPAARAGNCTVYASYDSYF